MHPLRSVARATQTIDHHKETIFMKWAQHSGVWGGKLMENPGGVCGVLPATCRARPLRSAASASQAIYHPQETFLAKWALHLGVWRGGGGGGGAHGKYGWRVRCAS